MTISSTVRIAGPFTGNGVTTTFPFTYKVFSTADVQVIRLTISTGVETTLTLVTDYNITLNGNQDSNPGGNIVLVAALSALYTLTATSNIANLQPTDLTNQGGFYPEVITDALDRATIQIQQISDIGDRTLKIPISDGALNMELPTTSQRINTILGFDSAGLPTVLVPQASNISGNTVIVGTLGVTGATTLSTTLGVTGATTLASVGVTGAATVGTTLGVTGATTLASVGVTGAATVGTTLGVTGATTLASVGVTGATTLASVGVTGAATVGTTLGVTGAATIQGLTVGKGGGTIASNTVLGLNALGSNVSGIGNTAVGASALLVNTDSYNVAVGFEALQTNTTGSSNSAVGYQTLKVNLDGDNNSAFGVYALLSNTSGSQNNAFGVDALGANTIGEYNNAFGYEALTTNISGNRNNGFGYGTLRVATGSFNSALGHAAGSTATTGSSNIFLGNNSVPSAVGVSNEVNIYNGSVVARFQGAAAAWTFVSDARDKDNIENLNFGLNFINQLQPRKFSWNIRNSDVDKGKEAAGFIAQELASVVESQSADCLGLVYTNDPNQFSIAQTNLIPVLVNAIKELNAKFEAYVATHP